MKLVKLTLAIAASLLVTSAFAARTEMVKSKLGDLDITSMKGGGDIICTAKFSDVMAVVKSAEQDVMVKADCGRGWVAKDKVEYVAAAAPDISIVIDRVDIDAWIDNPSAFDIFSDNVEDFEGVEINRDFREYLQYTMDREQIEMGHAEN